MKTLFLLPALLLLAVSASAAGHIKVHSSNRYFQDASGRPIFFLGAYTWASVAPGYYNNNPQKYEDMILKNSPFGMNYMRLSLGINRFSVEGGDPKWSPSWDGRPTPVPFKYVNGKADLDQWDSVFWDGLRHHVELAKKHNVVVHICLFDAVDFRPGDSSWRWPNSYWNVKNQVRDFYGDLDIGKHDHADYDGGFYRVKDFIDNTGVGYYQRKLIDKALAETADYDNVFYEIGNELLGSRADWNAELTRCISSKTPKAITQSGGRVPWNTQGFTEHNPNTPADVKKGLETYVGQGCPFWLDPDGSALGHGTPDDIRRSLWYSFTGGGAGWGGFGAAPGRRDVRPGILEAYRNLASFIKDSKVKFWEMVPRHELVSASQVNSCLAKPGSEYVVYVLNDPEVTLDLRALASPARLRLYDPRTAAWSAEQSITPGSHTIPRPPATDDWVIHIAKPAPKQD